MGGGGNVVCERRLLSLQQGQGKYNGSIANFIDCQSSHSFESYLNPPPSETKKGSYALG